MVKLLIRFGASVVINKDSSLCLPAAGRFGMTIVSRKHLLERDKQYGKFIINSYFRLSLNKPKTMDFIEISKYVIPAAIVFFTVWVIIHKYFTNIEKMRKVDQMIENTKIITPLRLQAYERVILFLERISPESLVMRVNQPGMTVRQFQSELLSSIRAEYEHNLSQQLYITNEGWEMVKNARGITIQLINTAGDQVQPDAPAVNLSSKILDLIMAAEKIPSGAAIEFLKKEVQTLF